MTTASSQIYTKPEWHRNNLKWLKQSDEAREEWNRINHKSKRLIKEREILTRSTETAVTEQLEARSRDIYRWKELFQKSLIELSLESQKVLSERKRLEIASETIDSALSVTKESLFVRKQRIGTDVVEDFLQMTLLKEEELLLHVKNLLYKTIRESANHIRNIMNVKTILEKDWSDKLEAYNIDTVCSHLHNLSFGSIAFYPSREELPDRWTTLEAWMQFTKSLLIQCKNELAISFAFRAIIENLLKDSAHDIKEQQDAVDLALAKQIAETADAIFRLKQHLKLFIADILAAEKLKNDLNTALREKESYVKQCQTRMHYRYERPNMELIKDPAQHSLIREIRELSESINLLKEQQKMNEKSLQKLQTTRKALETELAIKEATLTIEKERVVPIRKRFPPQYRFLGY